MASIHDVFNSDEGAAEITDERVTEIKRAVNMLAIKLVQKEPDMPNLLRKIHSDIKGNPELAYILTPEEIGVIVSSAEVYSDIKIVQAMQNKRVSKNDIQSASADDF